MSFIDQYGAERSVTIAETVTVMRTDGTCEVVPYPADLAAWQAIVGGYIEQVYLGPGVRRCLVVNEEGTLFGFKANAQARAYYPGIVGDAVLVEGTAFARWCRDDDDDDDD